MELLYLAEFTLSAGLLFGAWQILDVTVWRREIGSRTEQD